MQTASPTGSSFTPTGAQWRLDSVTIAPYATSTNFLFKFEFYPDGGNNLYIDDINIWTIGTVGVAEVSNTSSFSIFPNPIANISYVSFSLFEKQKVALKVVDVLGREIATIVNSELNPGDHKYSVNGKNMIPGIYFITFTAGEKTIAKKVVVN